MLPYLDNGSSTVQVLCSGLEHFTILSTSQYLASLHAHTPHTQSCVTVPDSLIMYHNTQLIVFYNDLCNPLQCE